MTYAQTPSSLRLGTKLRAHRLRLGYTQASLAKQLAISASYLNLIEHNRRPLTAALLVRAASVLKLDLGAFATDEAGQLSTDLEEVFADPVFSQDRFERSELPELAGSAPELAQSLIKLYQAYRSVREDLSSLAARVSGGDERAGLHGLRLPSEEVNDVLQRRRNHFPALEAAAEELWRTAELKRNDLWGALVAFLNTSGFEVRIVGAERLGGAVRRCDREAGVLYLSEELPPRTRNFQLAHQIGLLTRGALLDELAANEQLPTPAAVALCRVALANYFAGAVLMPYLPFLDSARSVRYDVELLGHRFQASFEQVCHRLTTLQRQGAEGVPFHFVRVDIAGNLSKRFSASGIRFARFGAACPRWNVHAAFLTPGMIRVQLSTMPDGTVYFCIACTLRKGYGGFQAPHAVHAIGLGCLVQHAHELVYSDGVDLDNLEAAVPVGVTCRLCERLDCEQRAFPPIQHALEVDEDVRGVSFYAPPVSS